MPAAHVYRASIVTFDAFCIMVHHRQAKVQTMQRPAPNRIPWPPIIYLLAVAIGLVLHLAYPLPWLPGRAADWAQVFGALLGLAALAIDLITVSNFRHFQTTVLPHRAASKLITTGPFAWSRNPIYVANTLLILAAGLYFGKLWLVLLAPLAAFTTQKLAIEREELHLAELFGAEWRAYAAKVRRWI
jgi:protein-S-isoprenylcysteine O-methyltransferase Ste14